MELPTGRAVSRGTEEGHKEADGLMTELLRDLGYGEGCDVFIDMGKWYA